MGSTSIACDARGGDSQDTSTPVVLIHGFPLTRLMWLPSCRSLPEAYRIIAPDLRGHGANPPALTLSIEQMADDLVEVLDVLGHSGPAVFVGLSMGGAIALDLWRRHRTRVHALALCGTRSDAESPDGVANRRAVADRAIRHGTAGVVDDMIPRLFGPSADPLTKDLWRGILAATSPFTLAAASLALANRPDSTDLLGTITCPTLVVAGEQDVITPPAAMERIHRAIPGSRYVVIPSAGHLAPVEQPSVFGDALRDFLSAITGSPREE